MDKRKDKVFHWAKLARITDKGDGWRGTLYKYNLTDPLTSTQMVELLPAMMILAKDLKTAIHEVSAIVDDMEECKYLNFAFHVILKGREFYYSSIADPGFCLYLIPDLYHDNILSIIKSHTNIKNFSMYAPTN